MNNDKLKKFFVGWNRVWLASWILVVLVMAASSVHEKIPVHKDGEEYGWSVLISVSCFLFTTILLAYWCGRTDEKAKQSQQ